MEKRMSADGREARVRTFAPFGSQAERIRSRSWSRVFSGRGRVLVKDDRDRILGRSLQGKGAPVRQVLVRHAVILLVVGTLLSGLPMTLGTALATGDGPLTSSYESVGVVGCSNTRQHVEGYSSESDADKFWPPASLALSGGTLAIWANNLTDTNPYWANFSSNLQQHGADAVWMQMCIRSKEASSTGMTVDQQNDVTNVIGEISRRTGGVPVFISPLNHYTQNDCKAIGPYGVPNAIELADWASASGLATRGPDTGPLEHSQLAKDLCHLNETGLVVVGAPMVDFFDAVDVPDKPPVAGFTYSPARPRVNDLVAFQDLSTDDGTIVSWIWSIDGVEQSGQLVQLTFQEPGTHEVTLSVTDDNNNITVTTKLITVRTTTNR